MILVRATNRLMDACMDGWTDGWMDRWMDGWMDGWIEGWMKDVYMPASCSLDSIVKDYFRSQATTVSSSTDPCSDCSMTRVPAVTQSKVRTWEAPDSEVNVKRITNFLQRVSVLGFIVSSVVRLFVPKL